MRDRAGRRFLKAAVCLALAISLLAACLGALVPQVEASMLVPLSIEQMTQMADSIVYVRTASTQARRGDVDWVTGRASRIETAVHLDVLRTLKGTAGTEKTIVLLGGTLGDLRLMVDTEPVFQPGETSILFLDGQGRVIGGPQGKLAVVGAMVPALGASVADTVGRLSAGEPTPPMDPLPTGIEGSAPVISDISPSSASAGTGTQVTLSGYGFGATQGSGHVDFFYRSGAAAMPAPVVSWSDAAITCIVPTASMSGYPGSAGSGPVTVTNSSGLTSSGYDFHVTFGYGGARWSTPTCSYLVNPNTSDTPGEETMVDAGALAWNPASNFKFVDAGTTGTTYWTSNDRNEIFWTTSLASGILAQAWYWFSGSTIFENDIGFNDNYAWGDGSGGSFDVQSIASHELGHWLNLRDLYGTADAGKVMYGFGGAGSVKRALDADDAAGILWIYGGGNPTTTTTAAPTTTTTTTAPPTTTTTTGVPTTTTTAVVPPTPTRYEQTDSRLVYSGTWSSLSSSSYSGSSMKQASSTGASVTIAFTGTGLDWIARKGTSSGIARVTLDGTTPVTVDLYNSSTLYKQKVWSSGPLTSGAHTVKIEYTGTKRSAATSTAVNIDALDVVGVLTQAPTPTRYEQTDSRLVYSGTWSSLSSSSYSGSSMKQASSTGASVTIAFTGTGLDWIARKGTSSGIARVTLDGTTPVTVDLYNSSTLYKQKVWSSGPLTSGAHTVKIEYTGTKRSAATSTAVNIDALDVVGVLTQAPTPTRYEQTDSRLVYSGTWSSLSSSSYSGSSMKQASSTGASVTIAFTGTGLDWIARKGTSSGIARVTLDGTTPVTVDLYNSSTLYKQKVWSSGPLTSGAHTVKIEYTGTKRSAATSTAVNIDALDVVGVLTAASGFYSWIDPLDANLL